MASMRKAIDAKCKQCAYDSLAQGNWRQQVQACTVTVCALWQIRPKSRPEKRKAAHE